VVCVEGVEERGYNGEDVGGTVNRRVCTLDLLRVETT